MLCVVRDEKNIAVAELREDLKRMEEQCSRLQQEKMELVREARAAHDYRDELDCLQQKVRSVVQSHNHLRSGEQVGEDGN